jgi:hypothetical protein
MGDTALIKTFAAIRGEEKISKKDCMMACNLTVNASSARIAPNFQFLSLAISIAFLWQRNSSSNRPIDLAYKLEAL